MTAATERLHLVQSSMKYSEGGKAATADVRDLLVKAELKDAPDCVGFTESPPGGAVRRAITRLARRRGYHAWTPKGDFVFAVHPRNTVTETGYVHVLAPNTGMSEGNYGERGLAFVTFQTPAGNVVTCHGSHWLTAYVLDNHPGPETRREDRYAEQTRAMVKAVVAHGAGGHLSFWQGDTNLNEQKDHGQDPDGFHAMSTAAGLRSVYDELDRYPATHGPLKKGSTIDVLGSYDPDRRVSAVDVKVRPPRHSDHRAVDAWFDVLPVGHRHG